MSLEGVIAANRFGLGGRPGEVARASSDPRGWPTAQITHADMPKSLDGQPLMSGGEAVLELTRYRQERRQMRAAKTHRLPPILRAAIRLAIQLESKGKGVANCHRRRCYAGRSALL